ncbi:hypothetical protein VOLCADRAFT_88752 [Volvox carteri f. nagariensis]|uniref:Uncharacterized protein n=1 Tax=Volvox carteri f. nagariensis TaxID=3068 RepID=D8TPV3_VOLCA|nr:uncharacterized protein VOLCADRAFT_88752 [Volvox carteri f. nagariensis]EFJ50425.1 hypothetical protein VOLCADRAFT_88752 [Volvox carteri f. nagariensis]|eukprot:XP_002948550.1 hypothetical protein VOLCADRAFT_88752 [Volvox carteri f. nagariensis]
MSSNPDFPCLFSRLTLGRQSWTRPPSSANKTAKELGPVKCNNPSTLLHCLWSLDKPKLFPYGWQSYGQKCIRWVWQLTTSIQPTLADQRRISLVPGLYLLYKTGPYLPYYDRTVPEPHSTKSPHGARNRIARTNETSNTCYPAHSVTIHGSTEGEDTALWEQESAGQRESLQLDKSHGDALVTLLIHE